MFKKGYKQTPEHTRKIALSNKGKIITEEQKRKAVATRMKNGSYCCSEENKQKMSQRMTGNKYRLGLSPINKGQKRPEMIGNKFGFSKGLIPWNKGKKGFMSRENHYNWKGGVTTLYMQIRQCFEYRQWRSDVFSRDNYTCVVCGDNRGGNLNADHIKHFSVILQQYDIKLLEDAIFCEELWDINNGRTLCQECHIQSHASEKIKNYSTSTSCY
jgi:hypothetical protein